MTLAATWTLAVLVVAAALDYRTRRVPNAVWIVGAIVGAPLAAWELRGAGASIWIHAAAAAGVAALAWTLWRAGQFGGADAKALILVAVAWSPVGYWQPDAARFVPALDALAPALLAAEAWRRRREWSSTPFLVPFAATSLLSASLGGLLWWPFVAVARVVGSLLA